MSTRDKLGLAVALLAAGALLAGGRPEPDPVPAVTEQRPTVAQAWPAASRADLRDLGVTPLLFLDATTAVGTAPTADGRFVRLLVESAGGQRELRRLPAAGDPHFDGVTMTGGELIWAETAGEDRAEIWAAKDARNPRRLTADSGNILLYGNQYDLVVAGGRVHWAAGDEDVTQIRSVPLTGGDVRVREEKGQWALSAWPWLTDDAGGRSGTIRMRNLLDGRQREVPSSGAEWIMCSPTWCRVMVMSGEGLARIDLMRPDGADRRRVAGPGTQAAVTDVAALDRFEVFSEPRPDSDLTGTAGLILHDMTTARTVQLAAAADLAATRDGMLWWSTGSQETAVWHTLDLRTI